MNPFLKTADEHFGKELKVYGNAQPAALLDAPCSYGVVRIHNDEKFEFLDARYAGTWAIKGIVGSGMYSPSGMGGCAVLRCQRLQDGRVDDFCADSIAAILHRQRNPGKTFDELKALAQNRESDFN